MDKKSEEEYMKEMVTVEKLATGEIFEYKRKLAETLLRKGTHRILFKRPPVDISAKDWTSSNSTKEAN